VTDAPRVTAGPDGEPASRPYLQPYQEAVRRHGPSFDALLWRNRDYQALRFRVLADATAPAGKRVADMGAGRGDLLDYLERAGRAPAAFVGVEGIAELLDDARRRHPAAHWLAADFVARRDLFERLVREEGVRVILFSGSLNTLDERTALAVLDRAWDALRPHADAALAFNFLSSAGRKRLERTGPARRFKSERVFRWALRASERVLYRQDYLGPHDATVALYTQPAPGQAHGDTRTPD